MGLQPLALRSSVATAGRFTDMGRLGDWRLCFRRLAGTGVDVIHLLARRNAIGIRVPYFHSLTDEATGPLGTCTFPVEGFRRFAAWANRRTTAALHDVVRLARGDLNGGVQAADLAIGFDDGYRDNYHYGFPVLREYCLPATIFVTTSHIRDRGGEVGCSAAELREMADNSIEIGAHSDTHPFLTQVSDGVLRREVRDPKYILEDILQRPCRLFSYPHGDHDERVASTVAEAGYEGAFTTMEGANLPGDDPYRLKRTFLHPYDDHVLAFTIKMAGAHEWRTRRGDG